MTVQGLVDLDELVLCCRDEQARASIQEAVACYRVGAFRSCIVATWIAVVFDFLHKLRELELTGDKRAARKLQEFEKIHSQGEAGLNAALKFEREVLDVAARDFELLTPLEEEDLERLLSDRHRSAHPSMQSVSAPYQPTAELARTHLRNAVEILLQREPVQGKAALGRLMEEVGSSYFPSNADDAVEHFKQGPLLRAKASLVRNFVIVLTKTLLLGEDGQESRRRFAAALNAVRQMHLSVTEDVLSKGLGQIMRRVEDPKLGDAVQFLREVPDTWQFLGADMRGKIKCFVTEAPAKECGRVLWAALDLRDLNACALERIERLGPVSISKLLRRESLRRAEFADRALELYRDSSSCDKANHCGQRLIAPLAKAFERDQVEQVLSIAADNGHVHNSFQLPIVLGHLRNASTVPEAEFDDMVRRRGLEGKCPWIKAEDAEGRGENRAAVEGADKSC